MNISHWTITQTLEALSAKQISAEELVRTYLDRIARHNSKLHTYITVSETAIAEARAVDERRARAPETLGPLAGVPISVKDLFDTPSLPTTYGSRHYANHRPAQAATVVQRLLDAGAILLGKTNLHEYAYGTTNENPHYGNAVNPWNRGKITGGSSGGSAASIAAGLAVASLGTDTGGSIRIPAALCGIVGLKPTFGRVSKAGVFPLAHSLDHVGPMTRTVRDAAILLELLAGADSRDPDSALRAVDAYTTWKAPRPIRVGIPRQFFFDKCHAGVLQTTQAAMRVLETNAVAAIDVDIPCMDEAPDAQAVIISAEALAVHEATLASQPELYGADVRSRLEQSRDIRAAEYVRAMRFRQQFRTALAPLFDEVDVILTPTTPVLATDVGQTKAHIGAQEVPVRGYLTRYTNPWNLSGLPAISIPCGLHGGLPVGLQLVGPAFGERKLLAIANEIARIFNWDATAPDYR